MFELETVYKHVYFRVEAGYVWGTDRPGMPEGTSESFNEEVKGIFEFWGWTVNVPVRSSGSAMTATKGVQKLYLHPQSFSGVVSKLEIKGIEDALKGAATFKHTITDIYEDVYDITTDEYKKFLHGKREFVEAGLLEAYTTKRSNLYHLGTGISDRMAHAISLKRVGTSCDGIVEDGVAAAFVEEVLAKMVKSGKIIRALGHAGTAYRAANAKELKKEGLRK